MIYSYKRWMLLLPMLVFLAGGLAHAAPNATVSAIVLDVKYQSGEGKAWTKAKIGMQLAPGSRVRTGKRSKCAIKFPEGSIVRLGPRSEMAITSIATGAHKVKLVSGQAFCEVVKGTGFSVEGSKATVSVQGTKFVISEYEGNMCVAVFEGSVLIAAYKFQVTVDAGQMMDVGQLEALIQQQIPNANGLVTTISDVEIEQISAEELQNLLTTSWPADFPTGAPDCWWWGLDDGIIINNLQGIGSDNQDFTQDNLNDGFLGSTSNQTGSLEIEVRNPASAVLTTAGITSHAGLITPLLALASAVGQQDPPNEPTRLGKHFYGPRSQTDTFGLWDSDGSFTSMRSRMSGIYKNAYVEVGGKLTKDSNGDWTDAFSEAFTLVRRKDADVIIGRQHYLDGVSNNSTMGTLFNALTFDGVRLNHQHKEMSLDLAWINSFEDGIVRPGDGSGWFGRIRSPIGGGQIGATIFRQRDAGVGQTLDISHPIKTGVLDFYGEVGDDPNHRHLETWGLYFPGIYQAANIDLFVEYAYRETYKPMWSALAYYEMQNGWTGMLALRDVRGGDSGIALGVIKRFGKLSD